MWPAAASAHHPLPKMRRLLSYGRLVHEELAKGHKIYVENAKGPGLWQGNFPDRLKG